MVKKVLSFFKEHPAFSCIMVILLFSLLLFSRQLIFKKTILPVDIILSLSPWSSFYPVHPYNPIVSDIIRHGFPWIDFFVKSVKDGVLPLWNPFIASGTPTPTAFFPMLYLFWPILLLSSPVLSFNYYVLLHIFLAGLFTYLFLREIKVGHLGSVVGALVFMFSQINIHWSEAIIGPASIVWLPLEFFLVSRLVRTKRLGYSFLLGVVFAFSFFGSMLQWFYYAMLATCAYAIFLFFLRWWEERDFKNLLWRVSLFLLALILFLGLSAVQSLPTLELGRHIIRTGETVDYVAGGVLGLRQIVTFLVPNFQGNPVDGVGWNMNLEWFMDSGYVGILPLFLAFIGSFYWRKRERVFFFALALSTVLLAFYPPINKIFYYVVPFYNRFRGMGRWLLIYAFAAAVLAGFGADVLGNIVKEKRNKHRSLGWSISGVGILAVLFVGLVFWRALSYNPPVSYLLKQVLIFLVLLLVSVTLILALLKFRERAAFLKYVLVGVVIVDVFIFIFPFYPSLNPSLAYPEVPSIKYLQSDKSFYRIVRYEKAEKPSVITPTFTPSVNLVYGISDTQQSSVFILNRYSQFLNLIEDHGDLARFNEIPSFIKPASLDSRLLDMLNVKYILSLAPLKNKKLRLVYDNEMKIYENKDVLPRVFLVPNWVVAKNDKQIKSVLKDKTFEPRETIVVEEPPPVGKKPVKASTSSGGRVAIGKYTPNEVVVDTVVPEDGFLFFGDNYYPGWSAYTDGKPSKIYRANFNFKAVFLRKGSYKVRFVFLPQSLVTGGKISLVTLCLSLATLLVVAIWHRKASSELSKSSETP